MVRVQIADVVFTRWDSLTRSLKLLKRRIDVNLENYRHTVKPKKEYVIETSFSNNENSFQFRSHKSRLARVKISNQ